MKKLTFKSLYQVVCHYCPEPDLSCGSLQGLDPSEQNKLCEECAKQTAKEKGEAWNIRT